MDGIPFNPFEITSDGSIVTTSGAEIDRETNPTFTITVRAGDAVNNYAFVTLTINLSDIDDKEPEIVESSSELSDVLLEDFPVGMEVRTITATDDDIGANAKFTFRLAGDMGFFDIDPNTGVITLIRSLNREEVDEFSLTVTATGIVTTSHMDSVTFTITVEDVNDNDPVFVAPEFRGSIEESVENGTFLDVQVNATDLDIDSTVTYLLIDPDSVPFDVDRTNGRIFTTGALDRESVDFYSFMVMADDTRGRTTGSSTPNALVEITILDVNDEDPQFTKPVYSTDVIEGTPADVIILQVHADDDDIGVNAEIEYIILSMVPSGASVEFGIDSVSGNIFPTSAVTISMNDPDVITLTVLARDQGDDRRSDTAEVVLTLIDRNLEAPQFSFSHYNCTVHENREDEIVLCAEDIVATEPGGDTGRNAEITYSIRTVIDLFRIDNDTVSYFGLR